MIYARQGEAVTCENGHPICEFLETVVVGQRQDPKRELGKWTQDQPAIGTAIPRCTACGASFFNGLRFHIGNSWRVSLPPDTDTVTDVTA